MSPRMSALRAIRQERGLSQVKVAAAAGTSVRTVQKIEHGQLARLELGSLVKVALALGVAPVDLVPGLGGRSRSRNGSELRS